MPQKLQAANFPEELKNLKQWCLWNEKKVPISPTGKWIDTKNAADYSTLDECLSELALGAGEGVGFIFVKGAGLIGIDLDDAFKSDGGLKTWALKILSQFPAAYVEISPSGSGLHIIVRGKKPGQNCRKKVVNKAGEVIGEVEMYDGERYFTMTGRLYDPSLNQIADCQEGIDWVYKNALSGEEKKEPAPNTTRKPAPARIDIIPIIEASAQGPKFKTLAYGSLEVAIAPYGDDHSRAVHALCSIISWYTDDFSVCDRVLRASSLYSGKWAPNPDARGRAQRGKWQAIGEGEFFKCRRSHEAKGSFYEPGKGRSAPEDDFTEEEITEEKKKGETEYERHIDLLLDRGEVGRDLLSGTLHVRENGRFVPVFTRSMIGALKGECQARGRTYKPSKIENYLLRLEDSLPPKLLIDIPVWDGEDRLRFMSERLHFENATHEVFEDLFKDWCVKMYQKIFSPLTVQNRCLLLSGQQGVGKDVWISSIFCGLEHYLSDLVIDGKFTKESDLAIVAGSSAVCLISEFEKLESLGVGTIKDLITKTTFTCVRKYDRDATQIPNRCSFIGACNPANVFRDSTGNRRFLYFRLAGGPGRAISWDYPVNDKAFSLQCLAQIKELAMQGYRATEASEDHMRGIQKENTPENLEDDLVTDFEDGIRHKIEQDAFGDTMLFRADQIDDLIGLLARNYGLPRKAILSLLKRAGCQKRTTNCRLYGTREAVQACFGKPGDFRSGLSDDDFC